MIAFLIAVLALVISYLYATRAFKYWEVRGIKYERPIPLFGTVFWNILGNMSLTQVATQAYIKYPNEKVVGLFFQTKPTLVLRDPEVIRRILTTEFSNFYRRGLVTQNIVTEPLLQRNLFFADGDLWRLLRQRTTPMFTSGKLRAMFPLVVQRAERLQARALAAAAAGRPLDARDLMARYTTDFIGAAGFGLDADSLDDENSAFRRLGANIFKIDFRKALISSLKALFPTITRKLKYLGKVEDELIDLVKDILHHRNYEPSDRNDFIDLLIECKKKGSIVGESIERRKPDGSPEKTSIELDDILMAAQAFVFFTAGFETSSSATSFTLHQLAYNPKVQKKVQDEIDQILAKHNNKLCYDSIKEMTYLEWTFKESMRMFPSLGFLIRLCTRKTKIPGLNVYLDKGVKILVPLQAIHNDLKYFEEPDEFRPERFSPDNFNERMKLVYMPFGIGPRACIGERMGLMQSIAGLAAVLSQVSVHPAPESKRYPKVDPRSNVVQSIKGGLPLIFKKR